MRNVTEILIEIFIGKLTIVMGLRGKVSWFLSILISTTTTSST